MHAAHPGGHQGVDGGLVQEGEVSAGGQVGGHVPVAEGAQEAGAQPLVRVLLGLAVLTQRLQTRWCLVHHLKQWEHNTLRTWSWSPHILTTSLSATSPTE